MAVFSYLAGAFQRLLRGNQTLKLDESAAISDPQQTPDCLLSTMDSGLAHNLFAETDPGITKAQNSG